MKRVYVWVDGRVTLKHCLPIALNKKLKPLLKNRCPGQNNWLEAAQEFLRLSSNSANDGFISEAAWHDVAGEQGISENLATAIFSIASDGIGKKASMVSIALSLILLGLEVFCQEADEHEIETPFAERNRSTLFYEFLKQNLEEIIDILECSHLAGKALAPSYSIPYYESIAFLDCLLEGLIDTDDKTTNDALKLDAPLSFSRIAHRVWKETEIDRSELVKRLHACLCADPFGIDDVSVDGPISSNGAPSKKTALGAGNRRRVFVENWSRIEILRRSVYRDSHLRLNHTRPKAARLFQPWRPILRNSTNIVIGPYNTYYSGMLAEYAESGLTLRLNEIQRIPILLDAETSFTFLNPSHFYVEPLPIQQEEDSFEAQAFYCHLPPSFEKTWRENAARHSLLCSDCSCQRVINSNDERYLKSKTVDE